MKTLTELVNTEEPGWDLIQGWLERSTNHYEILPKNQKRAENELLNVQVTTRSILGAVLYETGGIIIDNGWLRILGSGSEGLERRVSEWNKGKTFENDGEQPSHLLVADDVTGGYFAINAGGIGSEIGKIYYLAQDTLHWESLNIGYSDFLYWALTGDVKKFYESFRWENWELDLQKVSGNQVFSFYPFLWTREGKDIEKVDKKRVAIEENYTLTIDFQNQLNV